MKYHLPSNVYLNMIDDKIEQQLKSANNNSIFLATLPCQSTLSINGQNPATIKSALLPKQPSSERRSTRTSPAVGVAYLDDVKMPAHVLRRSVPTLLVCSLTRTHRHIHIHTGLASPTVIVRLCIEERSSLAVGRTTRAEWYFWEFIVRFEEWVWSHLEYFDYFKTWTIFFAVYFAHDR